MRPTASLLPTMSPSLQAALSSLSPEKVTIVATGREHLLRQRFTRQAVVRQVDQGAAAKVGRQRYAPRMGDAGECCLVDRRGEALHRVVAGVDLHQQRGVGIDGALVVLRMGAVGGADFDHARARARHHVGHAEGAADLDQFAARDDDFALARQRGNAEQHGGRIVVDDSGGLRAGDGAQQVFDERIAVAPTARGQVVFEVVGRGHHQKQALQRRIGQHGATEVGVDDRAGQVQHRTHARREASLHARRQRIPQCIRFDLRLVQTACERLRTQAVQQGTRLVGHQRVTMFIKSSKAREAASSQKQLDPPEGRSWGLAFEP